MLAKLVIVNGFICFIFSQNWFFRNGENKKETAIVYLCKQMWHIGDVLLSQGTASFEIEKMKTNLER